MSPAIPSTQIIDAPALQRLREKEKIQAPNGKMGGFTLLWGFNMII